MSLYASSESSSRVPAPAGAHVGRCYGVIDLGSHLNPQSGKMVRKILIQFELPNELHTFREEKGPEPFVVSREFGLFLSEKSHLRPFLEGWRGRPFTQEELNKFDVMVLAGLPCLINIIHNQKGDKVYANIASVMVIPKGMPVPPAVNPKVTLSLNEEYSQQTFEALPEWIRKKIQESPEYKSIINDDPAFPEDKSDKGTAGGGYAGGLEDDDIPFSKPHYLTVGAH